MLALQKTSLLYQTRLQLRSWGVGRFDTQRLSGDTLDQRGYGVIIDVRVAQQGG